MIRDAPRSCPWPCQAGAEQSGSTVVSGLRPAKVSEVASEVGYDSEAAFSRAFKKATGAAPAAWRDGTVASREAP